MVKKNSRQDKKAEYEGCLILFDKKKRMYYFAKYKYLTSSWKII